MSALRKGFSIIEAVTAAGNDGLPFSQIVAETGVAKATAHRLLAELVDMSLLTLDPASRCYRGGLSLARIGATVTADYDLRTSAHPHLQALHDEFGHVATLGVRNKLTGVYIDKIESRDFGLRLHSEIGKTFPLHCTAMGKVLLSHADKDTVRRITKRKLEAHTSKHHHRSKGSCAKSFGALPSRVMPLMMRKSRAASFALPHRCWESAAK